MVVLAMAEIYTKCRIVVNEKRNFCTAFANVSASHQTIVMTAWAENRFESFNRKLRRKLNRWERVAVEECDLSVMETRTKCLRVFEISGIRCVLGSIQIVSHNRMDICAIHMSM